MEKFELYTYGSGSWTKAEQRRLAVEAALKVINSSALGDGKMDNAMSNLSKYADAIQDALKVEQ